VLVVSPSQIALFLKCRRKWAAKYIFRLPDPPGPALTFGIEFHSAAEAYLNEWVLPKAVSRKHAKMVEDGAPHIPEPGTCATETTYAGILAPGLMYQCRLDFEEGVDVGDHKTTSGSQAFPPLTPETLVKDVQANMCAYAKYDRGAREVFAKWVYYHKKKRLSWPVRVEMPRAKVLDFMGRIVVPAAKEILALRANPPSDMNAVPENINACGGVGSWCNYSDECKR